ncbi:2'-5' RNA ligase family protein [Nocardia higoensis]|uniref:2'-5' RNA ligase family protein n=1 Tax=Nocardia higoensis TaxID=228599 RepID=UPI00031C13BF|nr:2'-5' RNA ligase family protein [Nocardia higoensis]
MTAETTWDHWWWRPGWKVGRSFYTWHITFEHDSAIADLVQLFAPVLAQIPTMAPVERSGLHITIQGIGFTDEVSATDIDRIITATTARLSGRSAFDAVIGPAVVDEETIGMPVTDSDGFQQIRHDLQHAIGEVWGEDRIPERSDRFDPHLSLAYSTGVASIPELSELLARNTLSGIQITEGISAVSLIELNRDRRKYEWREVDRVPLAAA